MKELAIVCVAAAVFLVAVPANAGWVEKTTDWNAQGLGGGGRLITDTDTDTLYYIQGNTIREYDETTDTWTALTPATSGGYASGDWWTVAFYAAGKLLLKNHGRAYVEIYDIASDTWSTSNLPTGGGWEHSWSQGSVYNTVDELFWAFWTDNAGDETRSLVGAAYNPATGAWTAPQEYAWPGQAHWGRMESVNIGDMNYVTFDNGSYVGQTVKMRTYDFTQAVPFPTGATVETSAHDLGAGRSLAIGIGSAFGVQCMAVHGGLIYLSGMDQSGEFLVYDPGTDSFTELQGFVNGPGGYRDHSTAAQGNTIYVQDGGQFWAYNIPEPGLMLLGGFGALALLVRRRR